MIQLAKTEKIKMAENKEITENGKSSDVIFLKNVTKKFGNNVVLDNITLGIEKGKTTVIIGPSGCGKTILIKHMIALVRPTSGEVYFKGQRIDNLEEEELSKIRINFGYLFQGGALFDSLTVAENIMFPIVQHYKVTEGSKIEELVKTKLALVGLDGFQNRYPAETFRRAKKAGCACPCDCAESGSGSLR